jgi:hypothetical protein
LLRRFEFTIPSVLKPVPGLLSLTLDLQQAAIGASTNRPLDAMPPRPPSLHRENVSISFVTATAGSVASDDDCSKVELARDWPTATRATREDILREMRTDMERYAWKIEREFGRDHGYCLYPPDRSELEDGDIDTDNEEDSTEELLPRAF